MSDIKITIKDNDDMQVDIELPEGEECEELDAKLRAALALLGIDDAKVLDDRPKIPLPEGVKDRGRK